MSDAEAFLAGLRAEVGATGAPNPAWDPVNLPMIRHWCEAMEDSNPNYLDADYAASGPHGGIVAPPTMLNAWTMQGLRATVDGRRPTDDPQAGANAKLDDAGYIGVVATNCEHVYKRYLRLGDHLTGTQKLVDVSEEKQTGLGIGHFVTTETEYHDQNGEHVGSMFFRILKFRPGTGRQAPSVPGGTGGERPKRPYPAHNMIQSFFWDGANAHELRIQRCNQCEALHHPPLVRCTACGSMDLGHVVSSGRGSLYSYAIPHYPQVPSFDYPLTVGLVELEEGTRLVSNVTGVPSDHLEVGMPLELHWLEVEEGVTLPQFRPARRPARTDTLHAADVEVGTRLPPTPVPITTGLIVTTALASYDFQDVHHDRDAAIRKGSKDIFMNILTTSGLTGRWVSDWAGPDAVFKNLKIRLGAPNYPYDTMTFVGSVTDKQTVGDEQIITIGFQGLNSLGAHVTGTVDLALGS